MKIALAIPPNSFYITNYVVVKLSNDAPTFISGLTSNKLNENETAFTDINGKIIAHAWQAKIDDSIFLLINRPYEEILGFHFKKYLRLANTRMEILEDEVYHIFSNQISGKFNIPLTAGSFYWGQNTSALGDLREIEEKEYESLRIFFDLPRQGTEFDHPMLLELNRPQLVAYDKGCYLGQEIIARVTSRGKPPRLLRRVIAKKPLKSGKGYIIKSSAYLEHLQIWISYVLVEKGISQIEGCKFFESEGSASVS